MSRAALLVLLLAACRLLLGDPDRIIALEIVGPTSYQLALGDTLVLHARARTARGDTAAAAIRWAVLDTGQVGIALDSVTGRVVAQAPGRWHVQARVEAIRSDSIAIQVSAPAASSPPPASRSPAPEPRSGWTGRGEASRARA